MASWFSKILRGAQALAVEEGTDYLVEELTSVNGVTESGSELEPGLDYMTIHVRSSRIVAIRKWTGKFYASVQSRVHYLHEGRGEVEYQRVIVPELRGLDVMNVDRFIVVDSPVVGPVPYRGGVSMELGLFSVKGGDLAGPYLDLLNTLANVSGVAFLGAALPYVEPLRKGADLLFGNAEQSTLEIGLDKTWKKLRTGTWILMRAPKGKVDVSQLRVDETDGKVTDPQGRPYMDYPYLVFQVGKSRQREDWMLIPELKQAWDAIAAAVKEGKNNEAETRFAAFEVIARWSPDLVPADVDRLLAKVRARLGHLQPDTRMSAGPKAMRTFPAFAELDLYDKG
jgi:hypothetical protein